MNRARLVLAAGLVTLLVAGIAVAASQRNFSVHASGDLEVPVRDTQAQGQAIFHLSKDGQSLRYKLIVANIENVFMAHIHNNVPGENGPIVVWLYPSTAPVAGLPGGGRLNGPIAQGVITAADFVAPFTGQTMSDLVELLQNGEAYVNVHTNDGVGDPDSGPGDFPGGEIRGNF